MAPRYDSKALTTGYDSSDNDNFEEWTTSKRKVNHKTRQVETRVSRQLLVEDGKVIADSGPQVTTRIKEDNKVEECEKEKAPKNKSKFDALDNAIEVGAETSSGRVLGEKKEIQRVSREVREENMQYHDERFKELTGHDVHRRALQAPHELITITDKEHHSANSMPRGKMVHYSNKGKKYQDTDEILEIAKLAIDGSLTKEVKRTRHHEEQSEDEQPDETGEGEELRQAGPKVERSSRRHVDYVNDFNDLETPSESSNDEYEGDSRAIMAHRTSSRNKHSSSAASGAGRHHSYQQQQHHHHHSNSSNQNQHRQHREQEEAFPRYEINPLLNSLNAETNDNYSRVNKTSSSHGRQIKPTLKDSSSESSDNEQERRRQHSKTSGVRRVESPSATSGRIKSNRSSPTSIGRDSAASGKYKSGGVESKQYHEHQQRRHLIKSPTSERARERSFSPVSKSNYSVKSSKSHREDASVQANLTDEEEEREKEFESFEGEQLNTRSVKQPFSKRLDSIRRAKNKDYYDYKTVVAIVHSAKNEPTSSELAPTGGRNLVSSFKGNQNVVETYNVRVIQHNSPFFTNKGAQQLNQAPKSATDFSNSIARLELLSSELGSKNEVELSSKIVISDGDESENEKRNKFDNNKNDSEFNLNNYFDKHNYGNAKLSSNNTNTELSVVIDSGVATTSSLEDDAESILSACSLRSSRTYNISLRDQGQRLESTKDPRIEDLLRDEETPDVVKKILERQESVGSQIDNNGSMREDHQVTGLDVDHKLLDANSDAMNDSKRPAAWVFDLRDNSSTLIVPAPKPKEPEVPKVETEPLAESKGGRAYYLQLVEKEAENRETEKGSNETKRLRARDRQREFGSRILRRSSSIDPLLQARSSSCAALNKEAQRTKQQSSTNLVKPTTSSSGNKFDETRKSRQIKPASFISNNNINKLPRSSSLARSTQQANEQQSARSGQLPFNDSPPLSHRSKSSSCLLGTANKPSKYSIYGGLKRADGSNKPVPRLSYSRAIGPKSQRQLDAQSKTPSRYLKMK